MNIKINNFKLKKKVIPNVWIIIFIGYLVYCISYIISNLLSFDLNKYGFIFFILITIFCTILKDREIKKADSLSYLIIIFITILFIPFLYNKNFINLEMFLKYLGFFTILLICYSKNLIDINKNKFRYFYFILIIAILLTSFLFKRTEVAGEMRLKGFFVNPNNLALFSFSLLFFLDEEHDKKIMKIMTHFIIIGLLIMSATSGAIIAYMVGMVYKVIKTPQRKILFFILIILLAIASGYFIEKIPFLIRIKNQVAIVFEERYKLSNYYYNVDYGELRERYGVAGVTSGLNRIQIWMRAMTLFGEQNMVYKLFGGGARYSEVLCTIIPHNEYIRILLDYGIIGLFIFLSIFFNILKRSKDNYRYIILIILIFCITENNLDNMLFMSLFSLFLPSAIKKHNGLLEN